MNITKFKRMNFKNSEVMLFHPNLLHGDSHNQGDLTRLSLEIRLYNFNELKNGNLYNIL
jgi:ectoine hydroxylase-related dioxygenase (phytanoyl-CoA dioxygenase family)